MTNQTTTDQPLYPFFYHYFPAEKLISLTFNNREYKAKNLECLAPCETRWEKTQPTLAMVGVASEIIISGDKITIQ